MKPLKTIQSTVFLAFMVLLIPIALLLIQMSRNYTEETVMENSREYTMQLLGQLNQEIDSYIEYLENISSMVMLNSDVIQYLEVDFEEAYVRESLKKRIEKQFHTILEVRNDITNLAVSNTGGRLILNSGDDTQNPNIKVQNMEWYKNAMEAGGQVVVSQTHVQNIVAGEYPWVVTLSRMIKNPDTGEPIGALMVDLNYNVINDLCKKINLGNKGYVYLLDNQGGIVYHPRQQMLYHNLIYEPVQEVLKSKEASITKKVGEEQKVYMMTRSRMTNWTAVGVTNVSELFPHEKETDLFYFVSMAVVILLALIISHIFSKAISRPIKALRNSMKEVEKGNFHMKTLKTDQTEIGMLGNAYNLMLEKIQELLQEQVEEQKKIRKNELRALQAQVNPHFLYNTLDSIIWMAEEGKNDDVVTMTIALSRLFRQNIHNEAEEITIREAVEYAENYLIIQQMRYQDQLRYEIQVDQNIMGYYMIRLIIQPLVENALYHGIKYKEEGGTIRILGYEEEDQIILKVQDDGVGMTEETLAHIFDKKPKGKGNGVGVRNVQERLQLHYGKQYGLTYESAKGAGTCVIIRIPKRNEVEQE